MGQRLDKERQAKLEPLRMKTAVEKITELGFEVAQDSATQLSFEYKGSVIIYYPYTGWATGKTIEDGRGLENLLKQLKNG